MAGVDPFHHHDPRIVAQPLVELAVADVEGIDAGRHPLQETVGETAGRRSDVETDPAGWIDPEADRAPRRACGRRATRTAPSALHRDTGRLRNAGAGFVDPPALDLDHARHHSPARLLAAGEQSPFDQQLIQTQIRDSSTLAVPMSATAMPGESWAAGILSPSEPFPSAPMRSRGSAQRPTAEAGSASSVSMIGMSETIG